VTEPEFNVTSLSQSVTKLRKAILADIRNNYEVEDVIEKRFQQLESLLTMQLNGIDVEVAPMSLKSLVSEVLSEQGMDVLVTEKDSSQMLTTDAPKIKSVISVVSQTLLNLRRGAGRIRLLAEYQLNQQSPPTL
jgi:hypothetical protein